MPSPPTNSLLNLLNPYASVAASQAPQAAVGRDDEEGTRSSSRKNPPESPSAVLLRELQFASEDNGSPGMSRGKSNQGRSPPTSPTPTPKRPSLAGAFFPRPDSSSDEEGPPQSVMFDGGSTPTSRSVAGERRKKTSPGPFRRRPSSASSSTQSPVSPKIRLDTAIPDIPPSSSTSESHSTSPSESDPPTARPWRPAPGYTVPRAPTPPTPGPSRTRRQGKHKYHAVATEPEPSVKKAGLSGYNKALWKWVNQDDLDSFLRHAYEYYEGKGIWCIALKRFLQLLTSFFVIAFTTFLTSCIDYSKLAHSVSGPNSVGKLEDALVGQCLTRGGFWHMSFILLFAGAFIYRLTTVVASIPGLLDMHGFYTHLLGIPDADIQTMPWPEVVRLIGEIRKHNPVTSVSSGGAQVLNNALDMNEMNDEVGRVVRPKLDAHDIANRILRKENYLIALFNKDLLDMRVRIPVPKSVEHWIPPALLTGPPDAALPRHKESERKYLTFGGAGLTEALQYNIQYTVLNFLFDHHGEVRKEVVRDKGRKDLEESLHNRFIFYGLLNLIFAPFITIYLIVYSFFRYFDQYHKNPSSIGTRRYTLFAQWKFREFNELPHLFERRLKQSYPVANEYIDSFPKERTSLVMRFVSFIAGSFAAVLLVASLIDPDLFLHFEITPHRTVLFYLGVFGSILAISRGMVPEENLVFDPEYYMRELVRYTHYLPPEWVGKLHSQKVHADFGHLFQLKIAIFAQELLSVLLTPFILWFSLRPCSGAIIDFFREFTIHVEDVGYVCSFAVFDFHRPGAVGADAAAAAAAATTAGAPPSPHIRRGRRLPYLANDKMDRSFLHFKATHPDWQPTDPSASVFLDKLIATHEAAAPGQASVPAGPGGGRLSGSLYHGNHARGLGLHLASKHSPSLDESRPGSRWFQPAELETMDEGEDEAREDDERGLHRDTGLLLDQVMNK